MIARYFNLRYFNFSFHYAVLLAAAAFLGVSTNAKAADPLHRANEAGKANRSNRMVVDVAPGNWGNVETADIQLVLQSVASEFQSHVGQLREGGLKLRVVPRGVSPRVLYERGAEGEYVVHLTARNDRWYQYAYQFSHELCHILSNFDHKEGSGDSIATGNQWFEESLCETASLFTLKRLAAAWTSQPPARKWIGYAPVFAAYADHLLAETHRHLPAQQSVEQWYAENRSLLRENPYLREKNELLATALLPLFENDANLWQAIAYLNADKSSSRKTFGDYLTDWHAACPPQNQLLVRQTMALLGLKPEHLAESLIAAHPLRLAQIGN